MFIFYYLCFHTFLHFFYKNKSFYLCIGVQDRIQVIRSNRTRGLATISQSFFSGGFDWPLPVAQRRTRDVIKKLPKSGRGVTTVFFKGVLTRTFETEIIT